jgi:hypothetical protein
MRKALVEVTVPAAAKKYDVYIPLESRMSEVKTLISGVLSDLSDGKFKADDSSVLCNAENGIILNINMTVADLGIRNGSKLMLI